MVRGDHNIDGWYEFREGVRVISRHLGMLYATHAAATLLALVVFFGPWDYDLRWRLAGCVPSATTTILMLRKRAALRQRLRECSPDNLCAWCLYDLRQLKVSEPCPECGRPFSPVRNWESWRCAGLLRRMRSR